MVRRRSKAITAVVIALVVVAVVWAQQVISQKLRERAAIEVVGKALMAMKRNDPVGMERLLYTGSYDYRWSQTPRDRRLFEYGVQVGQFFEMQRVPDQAILRTLRVRRNAPRFMVASILQMSTACLPTGEWPTWSQNSPVVVEYAIRGVPMASVALRENGVWKVNSIPIGLSPRIFRYKTFAEAGHAMVADTTEATGAWGDEQRRRYRDRGKITEVTQKNLNEFLERDNKLVMIYFWASWCAPCKEMKPIIDAVAKTYGGALRAGKVNIDEQQTIAKDYRVAKVPTVIFLRKGKEIRRTVGSRSGQEFSLIITDLLKQSEQAQH